MTVHRKLTEGMRRYSAFLAVAGLAILIFFGAGYVLGQLGLEPVDPNDKSYGPGRSTLRTLLATIVAATAAYPLLRRAVFCAPGRVLRYAVAWAALILLEEGGVALVAAGVLSGPEAALLLMTLALVPGFFLIRGWVFAPKQKGVIG